MTLSHHGPLLSCCLVPSGNIRSFIEAGSFADLERQSARAATCKDRMESSTEAVLRALDDAARNETAVDAEKAAEIELFKARWKANQVLKSARCSSPPKSAATRVPRKGSSDPRVASALGPVLLCRKCGDEENVGQHESGLNVINDDTSRTSFSIHHEEEAASNCGGGAQQSMPPSFVQARTDFFNLIPCFHCEKARVGLDRERQHQSARLNAHARCAPQSAPAGSNNDDDFVTGKPERQLSPIMSAVKGMVESPQGARLIHELRELRRGRQAAAADADAENGTDDRVRAWLGIAGVPNLDDRGP
jgi:hypothetical protein